MRVSRYLVNRNNAAACRGATADLTPNLLPATDRFVIWSLGPCGSMKVRVCCDELGNLAIIILVKADECRSSE